METGALTMRLVQPSLRLVFTEKYWVPQCSAESWPSPFPLAFSLQSRNIFGPISYQGTGPEHLTSCKKSMLMSTQSHHQGTPTAFPLSMW